MIRSRRRPRAAIIESSDDDEIQPWRKRLRATNNHWTVENTQNSISSKTKRKGKNKTKSIHKSKRKSCKRGRGRTDTVSDISSSDNDEKELELNSKIVSSDYVSETSNDDHTGKASSSSVNFPRNIINKKTEPKNEKTDSDCSLNSLSRSFRNTREDSSSSDSEVIINHSRQSCMRALSDYETGDSSERGQPLFGNGSQSTSYLVPENESPDSPSENEVLNKPTQMRNRCVYWSTTTDSSDSEVVVKSQRLGKRRRIVTSSEEIESDNSHSGPVNSRSRLRTNYRLGSLERLDRRNPTQQVIRQLRSRRNSQSSLIQQTESQSGQRNNHRTRGRLRSRRVSQSRGQGFMYNNQSRSSSRDDSISSASSDHNSESDWDLRSFTIRMEHVYDHSSIGSRTLRNRTVPEVTSSNSESDDSLLDSNPRRRGALVTIRESDDDTSNYITTSQINKTDSSPVRTNFVSSDSDGESEKCSICFSRFDSQEIGSPISCEHSFCKVCIEEWAKNSNTCPIDRKIFDRIVVRSHLEGEVVRELKIQPPTGNFWDHDLWDDLAGLVMAIEDVYASDVDDDGPDELCCVCRQGGQTNNQNLIVCDFCNQVYHMNCLNPPLRSIPVGDWSCPSCTEFDEFDVSSSSDSDIEV